MDSDVCLWHEKLIFYEALTEKTYNPSCKNKDLLLSKCREWNYCPYCGKIIEVKQ